MTDDIKEIFERVRDIPFRIPTRFGEQDFSCTGKCKILYDRLLGVNQLACYRVCSFLWDDLPLPDYLRRTPHDEECTHVYMEVFLGDRCVRVDPTWDKKLGKVFGISQWDGESDTVIAVKPTRVLSLEEGLDLIADDYTKDAIERDLVKNGQFYGAFNSWLEKIRGNS